MDLKRGYLLRKKKKKLIVFENKILRKIYGPTYDPWSGEGNNRKLETCITMQTL
jgi:hypothetical protein